MVFFRPLLLRYDALYFYIVYAFYHHHFLHYCFLHNVATSRVDMALRQSGSAMSRRAAVLAVRAAKVAASEDDTQLHVKVNNMKVILGLGVRNICMCIVTAAVVFQDPSITIDNYSFGNEDASTVMNSCLPVHSQSVYISNNDCLDGHVGPSE